MNMRNVVFYMAMLEFLNGTEDSELILKNAIDVFGTQELAEKALTKGANTVGDLSDENFNTLLNNTIKDCFITLKNDLEADALRDKENAS